MSRERQRVAPPVQVVAGIVVRGGQLLLTRRPPGSHLAGAWEFPGGKVRPGEPVEDALRRELEEEVGLAIRDRALLHQEEYAYGDRRVLIRFYLCLDAEGEPRAREGQEMAWFTLPALDGLVVPAANRRVLEILREQLSIPP